MIGPIQTCLLKCQCQVMKVSGYVCVCSVYWFCLQFLIGFWNCLLILDFMFDLERFLVYIYVWIVIIVIQPCTWLELSDIRNNHQLHNYMAISKHNVLKRSHLICRRHKPLYFVEIFQVTNRNSFSTMVRSNCTASCKDIND